MSDRPNPNLSEKENAMQIASWHDNTQTSFMHFVYDQARPAYLLQELRQLREAVIGAMPLMALVDSGHAIESLDAALCPPEQEEHKEAFDVLRAYVKQLAFGDGMLRARVGQQNLPLLPDKPKCILTEIKATKPDWSLLWDHVEEHCTQGGLVHDARWQDDFLPGKTWRARLEAVLEALNERFITQIVKPVLSGDPRDFMLRAATDEMLFECFGVVEPLEIAEVAAMGRRTIDPTRANHLPVSAYLEEVRKRGALAWANLSIQFREQGNKLVKEVAALPAGSKEQREMRGLAANKYQNAGECPELRPVAMCNLSMVFLQLESFHMARWAAQKAILGLKLRAHEWPTFNSQRSACAAALATGRLPQVPPMLKRQSTLEEVRADESIAWKSAVRLARALGGLCREELEKAKASDTRGRERALALYAEAELSYSEAQTQNPRDKTPAKEIAALHGVLREHEQRWRDEEEDEEEDDDEDSSCSEMESGDAVHNRPLQG